MSSRQRSQSPSIRETKERNPSPKRKLPTKERIMSDVPPPAVKMLKDDQLFDSHGKPRLAKLKAHLQNEGRLKTSQASRIIKMASELLRSEPNVLRIKAPVTICGDVHGQFYDLLKLFEVGGAPGEHQYLFLGDYVDRGCFSSEIVFYLFAFKIHFPKSFFMIRGNHECRHMTDYFNFKEEAKHKYGIKIYNEVMDAFDCLPLAAIVNDQFLCLHGGISPEIKTVEDISKINRFREPPQSGPMCDILWADPLEEYGEETNKVGFVPNEVRGCSYCYSYTAVCDFLDRNKLLSLIRAHEAQDAGYRMYKKHKSTGFPSLITMFSAPNYLDVYNNKGAILKYEDNVMNIRQFNCVPHPYWLPGFMDVFSWSLPFVAEKVCEMFVTILSLAGEEEEEEPAKELSPEDKAKRREEIRHKVRAVSKLLKMYGTLREEQEAIIHLKGLTDNNKIPRGLLQGGSDAIHDAIDSFEEARKADRENERRPTWKEFKPVPIEDDK